MVSRARLTVPGAAMLVAVGGMAIMMVGMMIVARLEREVQLMLVRHVTCVLDAVHDAGRRGPREHDRQHRAERREAKAQRRPVSSHRAMLMGERWPWQGAVARGRASPAGGARDGVRPLAVTLQSAVHVDRSPPPNGVSHA